MNFFKILTFAIKVLEFSLVSSKIANISRFSITSVEEISTNFMFDFSKHERLKSELSYARKFIKFHFKSKFTACIFKTFQFIREITYPVLNFITFNSKIY